MEAASMLPVYVDDPVPATVRVPEAVRLARDTLPENKPLPCTPSLKRDEGVDEPIPVIPPNTLVAVVEVAYMLFVVIVEVPTTLPEASVERMELMA